MRKQGRKCLPFKTKIIHYRTSALKYSTNCKSLYHCLILIILPLNCELSCESVWKINQKRERKISLHRYVRHYILISIVSNSYGRYGSVKTAITITECLYTSAFVDFFLGTNKGKAFSY